MHTHLSKQFGFLFAVLALVVTMLGMPASPVRASAPALVEPVALHSSDAFVDPAIPHTLTVIKAGNGSGKVTSSPPGITCGANCIGTSHTFPNGTFVTLTATAFPGSIFTGWSLGSCPGTGTCTVTMNAPISVTGTFMLLPGPFTKTLPLNGAINRPLSLTLKWTASLGATGYEYCIDKTSGVTCDTGWNPTGLLQAPLSGLDPGTKYYWQVRATNNYGTTYANGGAWWSFTTGP